MSKFNRMPLVPQESLPNATSEQTPASYEAELSVGEVEAESGFKFPKYEVNGREFVFRNRNEVVKLSGEVNSIDDSIAQPLDVYSDVDGSFSRPEEFNDFEFQKSDNPEALLLASNTPEGLLSVIAEVSEDEARRDESRALLDELRRGAPYESQGQIDVLLDEMYAATQFDAGKEGTSFNHEGFALVVAARSGDGDAQAELDSRRKAYYGYIDRVEEGESHSRREWANSFIEQSPDLEAFQPGEVALVHSTPWPIERNERGEVVLYPAGAKRSDKYPRSTIHMTMNSEIINHAQAADGWDNTNRLIVANLESVMGANGEPRVINPVDTYYSVNPGEALELPGALIVEPARDLPSLVSRDGDTIRYLESDSYTESQVREIQELSQRYSLGSVGSGLNDMLRESVLRMAQSELGVSDYATVSPGAHGINEGDIQDRITGMVIENDMRSGTHFGSPEGRLEKEAYGGVGGGDFDSDSSTATGYAVQMRGGKHPALPIANLEANRTVMASGYTPARGPQDRREVSAAFDSAFGGMPGMGEF